MSHLDSSYMHEPGHRLTRSTHFELAYDAEGNLTTKSNRLTGEMFAFTWDHRNRLTHILRTPPNGAAAELTEYRYDGLDRRIAIVRDGQTRWTYYEGDQPVVDYLNAELEPIAFYFAGERLDDLLVIHHRDEGYFWVQTDHLGSVRRLLDANGSEVAEFEYDSYGNPVSVSGTVPEAAGRFGFAGREWDPTNRLYYNRARYYDPDLGRFISADPIGFWSSDNNPYRYALNQPVRITDPTGLVSAIEYRPILTPVLGFYVGFGLQVACNAATGNPNLMEGALGAGLFGGAMAGAGHFAAVRVFGAYQPVASALPLPIAGTLLKLGGGDCTLAGVLSGAEHVSGTITRGLGGTSP